MKKILVILLAVNLLVSVFAGCSNNEEDINKATTANVEEKPTIEKTPTPEPTPEPTATPLPILKPVKVLANQGEIYKIYDNGEFGYIGRNRLDDYFIYSQDSYIEDAIFIDTIEEGIPVIMEDWEYNNYKNIGEKLKFEVILKNEVDQAEYDSKYADKIKEISDRYEIKSIGKITKLIDEQKSGLSRAYLIDTDIQQGVVFAQLTYYPEKLRRSYSYVAANPFEGNIIIDIAVGTSHILGVTDEGKVLSYILPKEQVSDFGQIDTSEWTNIINVATGRKHTIALKEDGTVVACGNNDAGQCDVSEWRDIIAVEATGFSSFGIKSDGSVISTGTDKSFEYDVSNWVDITQIKAGENMVAGLTQDGKVVVSGKSPYSKGLIWDTTGGALFEDIISINIAASYYTYETLVVLNSKGEIFYVRAFDYFMNYDEFKSGIDDIAATGEYSFALLKGDNIIYSSPDTKESTWDSILKNAKRYIPKTYYELNTKVSINAEGALKINEVHNQQREGLYTYTFKISEFFVFDQRGTKFLLLAENGDVIYIETLDYYDGPIRFESEILFNSEIENSKVIKIYSNPNFCAFLDENGNLHYPPIMKEKLTKAFEYLDWDIKTNWYRDTDNPPADELEHSDTRSTNLEPPEIIDLETWDEFVALFDGIIPKLIDKVPDEIQKAIFDDRSSARVTYNKRTIEEFDAYTNLLLESGYELVDEEQSQIEYDDQLYPLLVKTFKYTKTSAELVILFVDDPEYFDVIIIISETK